jgi:hypothetical protein
MISLREKAARVLEVQFFPKPGWGNSLRRDETARLRPADSPRGANEAKACAPTAMNTDN